MKLLYHDVNNPGQQSLKFLNFNRNYQIPKIVLDIDEDKTIAACRSSPFMKPDVIEHLIDILEMERLESSFVPKGRELTLHCLKTYILNGFKNMLVNLQ